MEQERALERTRAEARERVRVAQERDGAIVAGHASAGDRAGDPRSASPYGESCPRRVRRHMSGLTPPCAYTDAVAARA